MPLRNSEYYEGNELPATPPRPRKPLNPGQGGTAQEFKKFAEELAVYEVEDKEYRDFARQRRQAKYELRGELVKDLADGFQIPVAAARVIFDRVWEAHGSEGMSQVIHEFTDLIHDINQYNVELDKAVVKGN